jgi:hypothetical protein
MGSVNKKGQGLVGDYLVEILIFAAVVITVLIAYFILSGKGTATIEYIKNILGFRR